MKHDDKRQMRKLKRDLKRAGNKARRRFLKQSLAENPAEAAHDVFDFRGRSSATLNGLDREPRQQEET